MTEQEQAQQQAERAEMQRRANLRRAAMTLAEDKHGSDDAIIELKHAMDDAELAEKKFHDELRALQLDTRLAKAKYEQALDAFVDPDYRLSKEEWEQIMSRFSRG